MYKIAFNDGTSITVEKPTQSELIKVDGIGVIALVASLDNTTYPDLASVKAIFNDETKTSVMDILYVDVTTGEDGKEIESEPNKLGSYENYTKIQRVVAEGNEIKIYMVPQETLGEKITRMTEAVASLETSVASAQSEISTLKENVSVVDTASMSLAEYKLYTIEKSKENLAKWLEDNFVTSTVHGGVEKEYSITAEKQQLLTSMIVMAQAAGEGFQVSWNARGEACEYDWTVSELVQLAGEIETVVRPKISEQQNMEVKINAAASKTAVNKVIIVF